MHLHHKLTVNMKEVTAVASGLCSLTKQEQKGFRVTDSEASPAKSWFSGESMLSKNNPGHPG